MSKKLVIKHEDGMMQIMGDAEEQPPDLIEVDDGGVYNLITLKHCLYYLYKPMMHGKKIFDPRQL